MGFDGKNAATIHTNHATTGIEMRAIVQDRYGSVEVLRAARIDRPEIAEHEVLLRVHAAGLDRGTACFFGDSPSRHPVRSGSEAVDRSRRARRSGR